MRGFTVIIFSGYSVEDLLAKFYYAVSTTHILLCLNIECHNSGMAQYLSCACCLWIKRPIKIYKFGTSTVCNGF